MAIPTDEEVRRWRERWEKYPGLSDRILNLIRETNWNDPFDRDAITWKINEITIDKYPNDFQKIESDTASHIARVDLRGINWQNENLDNVILPFVRFDGSNLERSSWYKSHLEYASFRSVNIRQAQFRSTILNCTNFAHSNGYTACFENSRLISSDFSNSNMDNSNFSCADMEYSDLNHANFTNTKLDGASLAHCNIIGTNFSEAYGDRTNWGLNQFLPDCLTLIKSRDIRSIWKLFWSRWFYTDFSDTYLEESDTSIASDLLKYTQDQRLLRILKNNNPIAYMFWNITTACGWSTSRLLMFTFFVFILPFAFLYDRFPSHFITDIAGDSFWAQHVLTSVGTMLNIENLAAKPATTFGRFVVVMENVFGWIALGLSITIFANKYARRS